jgi:hypothetical protein
MKKIIISLFLFSSVVSFAQDSTEQKGFKKENLFTGGSITLSFGNGTFQGGVIPHLGYSITKWLDAGIVVNYIYTSYRDYSVFNDKLRQTLYGGGVFTRVYPLRFLFAQAQLEHNFINLKYLPPNGGSSEKSEVNATSFLVGAGYTTGRNPGSGRSYGYLAILFDIMDDENSPYRDNAGRVNPVIRAGFNIPLFQGRARND